MKCGIRSENQIWILTENISTFAYSKIKSNYFSIHILIFFTLLQLETIFPSAVFLYERTRT